MKNYITIENDYFKIVMPKILKEYGNKVLEYSTNKLKEYLNFFNEKSYGEKIKGAFLTTRQDFEKRIKELSPEANPPSWATGCFYGGEIQILLDIENPYNKFYTLSHETFHLLFQKFVYKKNNMDRIVWIDESLANNFDGTTEKLIENEKFQKIVYSLKNNSNLPRMSDLDFSKGNVKTENYDGYDLFKIVGRYLIETKNQDELIKYINNKEKIISDGYIILDESIKYFSKKYNL